MSNADATLLDIKSSQFLLRSLQNHEEYLIKGETVVGREKDCQIRIGDASISRYHAKLTAIVDAVFVEDLNSTNGTYINGEKISARQQIGVGDELRFHKHAFRLATSDSGAADATVFGPALSATATAERKIESRAAAPMQAPSPAADNAADHSSPDHTQVLSLQKLKALAKRAALAKNQVTAGSGPRLVILTAPLRGKVFQLPRGLSPGTQLNIGRGSHSNRLNFLIEDKTISQDHATLELTPHGWTMKATNARNGLSINGEPTTRSVLQHGDTIAMGRVELAFLTDEGASESLASDQDRARPVDDKKPRGRRVGKVVMILVVSLAVLLAALAALPAFGYALAA